MTKTGRGHDNVMGHRVISGLVHARPCERPGNLPVARLRGTKRLGLKYEKDFSRALKDKYPAATINGQWYHFVDRNGPGYCQTDLLVKLPDRVIIFECKLTDTDKGRSQLERLYIPVVGFCWKLPTYGVVVTRHLTKETLLERVTDQLSDVLRTMSAGIPTLHWRERNPL